MRISTAPVSLALDQADLSHLRSRIAPRALLRDLAADGHLISYPKCGRTWLRYMLGTALDLAYGIDAGQEARLELEPLAHHHPRVPRIRVTHDGHPGRQRADRHSVVRLRYLRSRVVLLVRDPRDVVVSHFFHLTKREKKHRFEGTPADFLLESRGSLSSIVAFYNAWLQRARFTRDFTVCRYEDLHRRPHDELARLLAFWRADCAPEHIQEAVEAGRFDRMRTIEVERSLRNSRLSTPSGAPEDSLKTRRGKVGGYVDYFDSSLRRLVDRYIARHLDPVFGYAAGDEANAASERDERP